MPWMAAALSASTIAILSFRERIVSLSSSLKSPVIVCVSSSSLASQFRPASSPDCRINGCCSLHLDSHSRTDQCKRLCLQNMGASILSVCVDDGRTFVLGRLHVKNETLTTPQCLRLEIGRA